jgi:hypothetical protein
MSYSVEGAEHNVMGCYENIDKECSTFMVHAKCRSQPAATSSAERGIIKGEDCQSTGWGRNVLFIYDKKRGVIAFDLVNEGPPEYFDASGDLSSLGKTASIMALVGSRGVLSCRF